MILYTTMPEELIFQENNDAYIKQMTIEVNGLTLVVERISSDQCRIVQLLSTNPNDFLNNAFAPGSVLMLKPYI